jgi:hypothetical protein
MKLYIILLLILIPFTYADDGDTNFSFFGELFDNLSDSILNIPELFFEFILTLLNQALEPFQEIIKDMLIHNPNIEDNFYTWKTITYMLSFFYILILSYAGLLFIVSGTDTVKRNIAKEWIKNVVIMLILVQGSYYIYSLILELNTYLNAAIINKIPDSFYSIQSLSYLDFGAQIILSIIYILILIITAVFLSMRIILIFLGVVLFPIGIFLYFIPPLRAYGKFIIHLLIVFIFSTFFAVLILLTVSNLLSSGNYQGLMKSLILICSYIIINMLFLYLGKFVMSYSAMSTPSKSKSEVIKFYKTITKVVAK